MKKPLISRVFLFVCFCFIYLLLLFLQLPNLLMTKCWICNVDFFPFWWRGGHGTGPQKSFLASLYAMNHLITTLLLSSIIFTYSSHLFISAHISVSIAPLSKVDLLANIQRSEFSHADSNVQVLPRSLSFTPSSLHVSYLQSKTRS